MAWDPSQYLKFAGERLRPALDLLSRIPATAPESIVDLGCGTGNLTPLILQRWPQAKLTGVDSSPEMLAKARAEHPEATFVEADVATWSPARQVDLIYSNAALHWVGNHDAVIPGLLSKVKPGGWLAIQMPNNFAAASHSCVNDAIEQGPWRAQLEPHLHRQPVADPRHYWRLLHTKCDTLEIWNSEYLQVLTGDNPVAEFIKGSWLMQFLVRLAEPQLTAFENDYRVRIKAAYPAEADGHTLFPFRRLFILAQRAA